jgi:hypothetical protein
MTKIAIIVFSDTGTAEAMGKMANAFTLANESLEHGDELKFIFEGAGTKWIGELEDENHKLHGVYKGLKEYFTGACAFCAQAYGVKNQVEKAGIKLVREYNNHPSLRTLFAEGYQVLSV